MQRLHLCYVPGNWNVTLQKGTPLLRTKHTAEAQEKARRVEWAETANRAADHESNKKALIRFDPDSANSSRMSNWYELILARSTMPQPFTLPCGFAIAWRWLKLSWQVAQELTVNGILQLIWLFAVGPPSHAWMPWMPRRLYGDLWAFSLRAGLVVDLEASKKGARCWIRLNTAYVFSFVGRRSYRVTPNFKVVHLSSHRLLSLCRTFATQVFQLNSGKLLHADKAWIEHQVQIVLARSWKCKICIQRSTQSVWSLPIHNCLRTNTIYVHTISHNSMGLVHKIWAEFFVEPVGPGMSWAALNLKEALQWCVSFASQKK